MSEFSDIVTRERPLRVDPAPGGKSGALVATYEGGVRAIIKATKDKLPSGHRRQRGILVSAHPTREVAFYRAALLVDELIRRCEVAGRDDGPVVPETVLTRKAVPGVTSSAQVFVPALQLDDLQPKLRELGTPGWGRLLADTCAAIPKRLWKHLLALDIVGGVRDRHANNVGVVTRVEAGQPVYRPVAWDNAVSFGRSFDRYHNVFHKHIFRRSVDFSDMWPVIDGLTRSDLRDAVGGFLQPDEVEHAFLRARFFVDYPYRLPWKVCSKGNDDSGLFPSYDDYFDPPRGDVPLHMARVSA